MTEKERLYGKIQKSQSDFNCALFNAGHLEGRKYWLNDGTVLSGGK